MNEKVGIIKEIDSRIVIPKEIRERLSFDKKVEIIVTKDGVLLRNPEYILVKVEQESQQ